ncbi:CorA-like Mg2+ transporter domain-containing protein [Cryptosporidium serpentis]
MDFQGQEKDYIELNDINTIFQTNSESLVGNQTSLINRLTPKEYIPTKSGLHSRLNSKLNSRQEDRLCNNSVSLLSSDAYIEPLLSSSVCTKRQWIEKYSQKQRKITVICIKDGKCSQHYMNTAELLRKVHLHNEKQLLEEKAAGALTLRDLRQVIGHGNERPSIEIRRNCILVNMPGVRCIILHDKVYYLPLHTVIFPVDDEFRSSDEGFQIFHGQILTQDIEDPVAKGTRKYNKYDRGIQSTKYNKYDRGIQSTKYNIEYSDVSIIERLILATQLYSENAHDSHSIIYGTMEESQNVIGGISPLNTETINDQQTPLELNALEVCLVEVCYQLWNSYYTIDAIAQENLKHIENNPTSTQKIHEINDIRKRLDSLRDRIHGVYGALKEILDDDDLLARIEISKFWSKPESWDRRSLNHTFIDSEILLECYEQEIEGLVKAVNRLDEQLDDAVEIMQIHLATIRNTFLKSELSLDIVDVCVGFVAAIASIFGMNIQSGLEASRDIFWFMAYTMLTLCVIAGIIVVLMFRRLQL